MLFYFDYLIISNNINVSMYPSVARAWAISTHIIVCTQLSCGFYPHPFVPFAQARPVLSGRLPVGTFVKRTKVNRFAPETEGETHVHQSLLWLLECEQKLGTPLRTRFHPNGEKKVFLKNGRTCRFDGLSKCWPAEKLNLFI